MDAEEVVIEWKDLDEEELLGFYCNATFVMRNQTDHQVNNTVAFPLIGLKGGIRDKVIKVEIGSTLEGRTTFARVKPVLKQRENETTKHDGMADIPPKKITDFPSSVVWDVSWAPGETKIIRVSFEMGWPMTLRGSNNMAEGWQVMYIVSTGALWKGPIGRADISIKYPVDKKFFQLPLGDKRQVSYPENIKQNDENTIVWHFENWTPTEEIWLAELKWRGLPPERIGDYFYGLPTEYTGDKNAYTDAFLETLIEKELTFARKHLPDKVASFDTITLKIAISDWLLHEIYARHGDLFYVGQGSPRAGVFGDTKGNLYSFWQEKFRPYSRYKGWWYQPNDGPVGGVKMASLSEIEQRNVRFLRTVLTDLRAKLPLGEEPGKYSHSIHIPGLDDQ